MVERQVSSFTQCSSETCDLDLLSTVCSGCVLDYLEEFVIGVFYITQCSVSYVVSRLLSAVCLRCILDCLEQCILGVF